MVSAEPKPQRPAITAIGSGEFVRAQRAARSRHWVWKKGHVVHEALNDDGQHAAQQEFLADAEIDDEFARRNRHVGCGSMISNASPSAQANRLFFRTKGFLWCIGDPSQRFPVPADCPERGRVE